MPKDQYAGSRSAEANYKSYKGGAMKGPKYGGSSGGGGKNYSGSMDKANGGTGYLSGDRTYSQLGEAKDAWSRKV